MYKDNIDRIAALTEDKLLATGGPQSDCVNFSEYIAKNIALYQLNNDVKLSTKAAATFVRGEVRLPPHGCFLDRLACSCHE